MGSISHKGTSCRAWLLAPTKTKQQNERLFKLEGNADTSPESPTLQNLPSYFLHTFHSAMAPPAKNPPTTPTPAGKKRKVQPLTPGAAPPAPPTRPPSPAPSIAEVDYDMGVAEATTGITQLTTDGAKKTAEETAPTPEKVMWYFGDFFDDAPLLEAGDFEEFERVMRQSLTTGTDRLDVALVRKILAHDDDDWLLQRQITTKLAGSRPPTIQAINGGSIIYRVGKPSGGTLVPSMDVTFRSVKNRSFAWIAPLQVFWPPAVCIRPTKGASAVWDFKLKCSPGKDLPVLEALGNALKKNYKGAFFAVVRATLISGWPLF